MRGETGPPLPFDIHRPDINMPGRSEFYSATDRKGAVSIRMGVGVGTLLIFKSCYAAKHLAVKIHPVFVQD